MTGIIDKLEP